MARKAMAVDVGAVGEFEHARPRIVAAEGRELGVIRWGDAVSAIRGSV